MTDRVILQGEVRFGHVGRSGEFVEIGRGSVDDAWDWVWALDDDQFDWDDEETGMSSPFHPVRLHDSSGVEWAYDDGEDGPAFYPVHQDDGSMVNYVYPPDRLID